MLEKSRKKNSVRIIPERMLKTGLDTDSPITSQSQKELDVSDLRRKKVDGLGVHGPVALLDFVILTGDEAGRAVGGTFNAANEGVRGGFAHYTSQVDICGSRIDVGRELGGCQSVGMEVTSSLRLSGPVNGSNLSNI